MADLRGLPPDLQAVIGRAISQIDNISLLIEGDFITPAEWQIEMETIIKQFHEQALEIGGAGADVSGLQGTVDRLVAIQEVFLANFAADIRGTDWLPSYLARAQMYGSAIKQAYWQGEVVRQVGRVLPLPAMPAEGTQCLCITTPESRVFTKMGYIPIAEIKPGMKVLTHRLRWRRVVRTIISRSTTQQQVFIKSPEGAMIGCTDDHKWLTGDGWWMAKDIYDHPTDLYSIPIGELPRGLSKELLFRVEVLPPKPLPFGTLLYDIEVEKDHSFIIEGVITHNSNCKCTWRIEVLAAEQGNYDAYWERNVEDSCQTCIEREAQWSPVRIRGGELL